MEASSGVAMEQRDEDAGTEAVERTEAMQMELVQSVSSAAAAGDADGLVRVALRASQLSMQGPALAALEALLEVFSHPLPASTLSTLILDLSSLLRADFPASSPTAADPDVADARRAVRLVLAASHLQTDDDPAHISALLEAEWSAFLLAALTRPDLRGDKDVAAGALSSMERCARLQPGWWSENEAVASDLTVVVLDTMQRHRKRIQVQRNGASALAALCSASAAAADEAVASKAQQFLLGRMDDNRADAGPGGVLHAGIEAVSTLLRHPDAMAMLSPVEAVACIVRPVRSLAVAEHADLVASLLQLLGQIRSVGEVSMQPEHVESILSLFTTAAAFPAVLREAAGALRHTTRSDRSVLLTQIQRVASLVLGTVDRHPAALRLHASLLAFAAVLSGEKPQPHLAFADVGLPHCCAALLEAAEQGSSQVGAEDLALATAYADAAVEAATNAKAVRRLAAVTIARRESPTPSAASRAESAGGGEAQEEQDPTREALLTRLRDVGLPAAVVAAARAHKDSKPILTAALSVAHAVLRCGTLADQRALRDRHLVDVVKEALCSDTAWADAHAFAAAAELVPLLDVMDLVALRDDASVAHTMTRLLDRHTASQRAVEAACRALLAIARRQDDVLLLLSDEPSAAALHRVVHVLGPSPMTQRLLTALLLADPDPGKHGALHALRECAGVPGATRVAAATVGQLARSDASARYSLVQLGAPKVLAEAAARWRNDAMTVGECMWSLSALSQANTLPSRPLVGCGAKDLALGAMEAHPESAAVEAGGSACLRCLLAEDKTLATDSRAWAALTTAAREHGDDAAVALHASIALGVSVLMRESLSAIRSECLQVLRALVAAQSQHYAQPDEHGMKADDAAAAEAGRGRDALPLSPAALATLRMDILHHSLHAVGELLRREPSLAAEAWAVGAATSTVRCLNAMAASTSASLETLYEVACGVLEALCAGQGARARTVARTEGALGHLAEAVALMGRSSPPHRGVALPLSLLALAAHRQKGKRGAGEDVEDVQSVRRDIFARLQEALGPRVLASLLEVRESLSSRKRHVRARRLIDILCKDLRSDAWVVGAEAEGGGSAQAVSLDSLPVGVSVEEARAQVARGTSPLSSTGGARRSWPRGGSSRPSDLVQPSSAAQSRQQQSSPDVGYMDGGEGVGGGDGLVALTTMMGGFGAASGEAFVGGEEGVSFNPDRAERVEAGSAGEAARAKGERSEEEAGGEGEEENVWF